MSKKLLIEELKEDQFSADGMGGCHSVNIEFAIARINKHWSDEKEETEKNVYTLQKSLLDDEIKENPQIAKLYDDFFGDGYWEKEYKIHIMVFARKCLQVEKTKPKVTGEQLRVAALKCYIGHSQFPPLGAIIDFLAMAKEVSGDE